MDYVIIGLVLVLVLTFVFVRKNKPQPTPLSERALPDPQDLLAGRMAELAAEARQSGRYEEGQLLNLKAAWLKTRPLLGQDDPPAELSANEQMHLRLAGDIWEKYSLVLSDGALDHAGCVFRPQSSLPYPKEYIEQALSLLVEVGEGHIQSMHFKSSAVPADVVLAMKDARAQLDRFVDVDPEQLPTDPTENSQYGSERGWNSSGV